MTEPDQIIDLEVAERFLQAPDTFDLAPFTSISDEAAKHLGNHAECPLSLTGLTSLSPEVAGNLSGLPELLSIFGLESIDDETAEILAGMKWPVIIGDAAIAEQVGRHLGPMSSELAEFMIEGRVDPLPNEGRPLHTGCYLTLSLAAAQALAKATWPLILHQVRSISDEVADALGEHQGSLTFHNLESVSDNAVACLSRSAESPLYLNGVRTLSATACGHLAKIEHILHLEDLTELSDEAFAELEAYKGGLLNLSGLTSLSENAAASIAQMEYSGWIDLSGVLSLSDEAAENLVRPKDFCWITVQLGDRITVSDKAGDILGNSSRITYKGKR